MVALAVALVSCSSETPGDATSGDGDGTSVQIPTEGGDSETTEPPETSESGTGSADSLEPCELFSSDDLAALSLTGGQEEELAGARVCLWQATDNHTVSAGVWANLGIDDVQSKTPPEPKTVGSRPATQYTGELGVCVVALELTETSRVDVTAAAQGDLNKACSIANQAAELVEPKLP
ncbi:DUF3558 family protein [Actinophytocola xinjiangensis]|uniref:DUF3558 family protein n=1 Tax=Actinophytocola xinjiangensis TaxID=485602 RepID=UPI00138FD768|nr:DUF3558 family protein [Actinophytocola xinjiangensis]